MSLEKCPMYIERRKVKKTHTPADDGQSAAVILGPEPLESEGLPDELGGH